ncbi:hypothetical protein EPO15_17485 [bacterium]|nr:MAG: hypothetical protein EPO15_17485 [bacterium]
MPKPLDLEGLLYTYKEVGTVEKKGVKYKKYAKVPRFRSKHKALLGQALLVLALAAVAFKALGWFLNRDTRPPEDRPPSQFQGFN